MLINRLVLSAVSGCEGLYGDVAEGWRGSHLGILHRLEYCPFITG